MGKHQLRHARIRNAKKTDERLKLHNPKINLQEHHAEILKPTEADEFFSFNKDLGPPYQILLDASFIN